MPVHVLGKWMSLLYSSTYLLSVEPLLGPNATLLKAPGCISHAKGSWMLKAQTNQVEVTSYIPICLKVW